MAYETIIKVMLSNGLGIHLKPQPHQRTISLGLFVFHGSKDEDLSINGIAHYIEHVLFNPAYLPGRSRSLLNALLEQGASYQAYTTKEHTRFTITCLPRHVPTAIRFLGILVRRRQIPTKAVEHERPIILQEHAMHFSSNAVLRELLDYAFWGESSLGLFVLGRKGNIERFTRRDLEERVHRYYTPERTHIVALGPIDVVRFVDTVAEHFDQWESVPADIPEPVVLTEPRITTLPTGHQRADLYIGYLGVPFHSADRPAMELLADVLGGGIKSRLFRTLRETRKMVYLVHAFPASYSLGGYLAIRVECDIVHIQEVFRLIQYEIMRLKDEGVTEQELERVKAARATGLLRVLEDTTQHLQLLGRYATLGEDFFVDLEARRLKNVQADHVMRVAREVLDFDNNLAMASIGPKQEDLLRLL